MRKPALSGFPAEAARAQPAFAETDGGRPPRWRRCRINTAPTEIAASTATAIRIGTKGEESPPLSEVGAGDEVLTWLLGCNPAFPPPLGLVSGLP